VERLALNRHRFGAHRFGARHLSGHLSGVALLAASLVLGSCGGLERLASAPSPATARAALEERLVARNLSYEWVVCVRTARQFDGRTVFRCNVNFGEPHIVRYCATLDGGELVTNREEPMMRCGRPSRP
jgi:hypothetical protein